jgi:signal transduction histidine kinase
MRSDLTCDSDHTASIELARRLHDTIAQRLTGLSCYLGDAEEAVPGDALERCREEIHAAIDELRAALDSVGRTAPDRAREVEAQVAALRRDFPDVLLDWRYDLGSEPDRSPLVASFLVEALCNVRKHAQPHRVAIETETLRDATIVTVNNDGVRPFRGRSTRQGSRLLALEATAQGAVTDSHPEPDGHWRQRLIMPRIQFDLIA